LEQSFWRWAEEPRREDLRFSRKRILLIFLLVRYTGAKLSEILSLNLAQAIDTENFLVLLDKREVQISQQVGQTLQALLNDVTTAPLHSFAVDPAFVRRKFYERAMACGFPQKLGGPEMIRKARAVELMQGALPVPAVQRILGHSTPNLTTACVTFSEEDLRQVTRWHIENESRKKTSARNIFWGKVRSLVLGDVQTLVELATLDGGSLLTIVTNTSAEHLGLMPGRLLSAEIKAPWMILERQDCKGRNNLENQREGTIVRIRSGKINTECAVLLADGTELCAIVSSPGFLDLNLSDGDSVRVLFSCYAVVLHSD
ncbi:MAG: TOBE domain-containing protein, partial [Desulfovibrionales bacterium]|nr:TOBE domain-containing protein [Desulfovibrionales bacterium]